MRIGITLAIAALILHAAWRVGSSYWTFYAFQDELQQVALFAGQQSDEELRARVMKHARDLAVPVAAEAVSIRRDISQVRIEAPYTTSIEVVPRYRYPKTFQARASAWSVTGPYESLPVR